MQENFSSPGPEGLTLSQGLAGGGGGGGGWGEIVTAGIELCITKS